VTSYEIEGRSQRASNTHGQRRLVLLGFAFLLWFSPLNASDGMAATQQEWQFRVFVDDKEVGTHEFRVDHRDEQQFLSSVADFEYKLLFVTLYDYKHQNQEVWRDGCLQRIESSTDANGKDYSVLGERQEEGFVVTGSKEQFVAGDCVMSFAYWNPAFLKADKLLNTQNGEYLDVAISMPVDDEIKVNGMNVAAQKYSLKAKKLDLELWYSKSGEWLGLQTQYENGRTLRYELLPRNAGPVTDVAAL
jgi:hypothetical protein